jgi:hypothetical protein
MLGLLVYLVLPTDLTESLLILLKVHTGKESHLVPLPTFLLVITRKLLFGLLIEMEESTMLVLKTNKSGEEKAAILFNSMSARTESLV